MLYVPPIHCRPLTNRTRRHARTPPSDRPSLPASRCLPATSARLHNDPSGTDRPTKSGGGTARWWWWCVAANLESFTRAASSFARARDWLSSGRLSQRRAWHRVETVEKLIQYNYTLEDNGGVHRLTFTRYTVLLSSRQARWSTTLSTGSFPIRARKRAQASRTRPRVFKLPTTTHPGRQVQ